MMGTTASTAQQTVSAAAPQFENLPGNGTMDDRHSVSLHSFQTIGLHNSKAKSIITNKVAPVVITYNCREEFQIHDDLLKANYTVGRISENSLEHYLVQGRYFIVRDVHSKLDVLNTTGCCGAPNFRQAKGGFAVFGMGQPSLGGFQRVLQKLQSDGYKECIFFCVREEPVLFLASEGDFVPHTPRDKESLSENLHGSGRSTQVESLELAIRKEIRDFAQLSENTYYVYHDIETFREEPHTVRVQSEDDVRVTEEVYKRPVFLLPSYRYRRLPLPVDGAPPEAQFDAFVAFLRESPSLLLLQTPSAPPPALLFSCQTGVGRTNLGMVMGTLVLYHRQGASKWADRVSSPPAPTLPREHLRLVQNFISMVPKGSRIVEEVDSAIAFCSELHHVKEAMLENKKQLEGAEQQDQAQGKSGRELILQKTLKSLERYFYLIAFNYYLHEQYPLAFALNFSRWMCGHPELYRLQTNMIPVELAGTAELIAKGTRVLVADERFSPDVLSTIKEMDVANFRRVPKMPIYGTAQPSSKAIGSVLSYLTDAKRKFTHILWVNLREEMVLEGNEQTYTLREPGHLDRLIPVPATSPEQLEKLESQLQADLLASQKGLEVSLEPEKPKKLLKSCMTMQDVFNLHKGTHKGLLYYRVPIPDFCAPREQDFDRLLEVMKIALAKDADTGFVFNCLSGQGRTTTAMVIAVLSLWHSSQGVPEMGEEEIVSVPDAKYTKGEFEVVMKVVQLLPDGHRMKKEVDMALDTVSETMTPMHYHLREIIICTYRQGKAAKEEQEVRTLQLRSLQYLERYIYLILFNAYLHLEKKGSWQRPFSVWMREVAAKAGIYDILNQLGFTEFETTENQPLSQLRYRWKEPSLGPMPFRGSLT
ncbi:paladin isoform X1 [Tachyglossus aculeatus]|uniref:paladin isoform X1 n=1 Tax=Tachyglossus aculeatus TaxID=9261 RepID=UPI0018F56CEE|nr:paladin isoform X1 [Tachyglossus aculeatus]